ncbi:aminoglycoside phosphotransferase family protein [Kribbella pittospori]|uniref:Aminoglycoside phosphotransferase family protein n=1 Tax=Kribbella pittospori TaxID=722689 RepID=A0A4R0KCE8_9ACTN|nr:aminoglycoside phosphotransferase family protein [Kribbella pittospori]TCC57489.1 aminoglycoside phosphotransferase family protein [Kribbella pittospori]
METKTVEAVVSVGHRYVGRVPAFEVEPAWWSEVEGVTRQLDQLLGVRTIVLRLVHADEAVVGRGGRVVYHVQALGEPRAGVVDETPYDGWDAIVAAEPLRATWAEVDGPGWLIEWARGIIGPLDPVQVKTWNLSCLIRFPGAWAKATSRFGSIDADIIDHIHRYDGRLAPTVLGTSAGNRWSLLAHAPGADCWEPDPPTIEDVVSRWVAVQAELAAEVDELDAPVLRPEHLADEVSRLLTIVALPGDDVLAVEELLTKLPGILSELDASGLPITLVHGDFHPGNWRSDGTNRAIVDWADSFVGHPATDIQRLRGWMPQAKGDHAVEVWSAAWKRRIPNSEPFRALQPMTVLGRLVGAVMYQRFLENIEPDERIYHADDPRTELQAAVEAMRACGW